MTLNISTPAQKTFEQYPANGSTSSFNYTWLTKTKDDIAVYKTPAGQDPDPVADKLTVDTDYTVTGLGNVNGGTVDLTTTPANGDVITLTRDMELSLDSDYAAAKNFNGNNLDEDLQRLLLIAQQIKTLYDVRALHYKIDAILPEGVNNNTLPALTDDRDIWMLSDGQIVAVQLEENPDVSALRSELAVATSEGSGAHLVGIWDTVNNIATTVKDLVTEINEKIVDIEKNTPQLATVQFGYFTSANDGWFLLSADGTIGNASSAASLRANDDTENLFKHFWTNFTDALCPVVSGRGASADADWSANKQIFIPKSIGRAVAIAGEATLNKVATPDHTTNEFTVDDTSVYETATLVQFTTTGTLPTGITASTNYALIKVNSTTLKIAASAEAAHAGTAATISDNGSGTLTIVAQFADMSVAQFEGYRSQSLSKSQMPYHDHISQLPYRDLGYDPSGGYDFYGPTDDTADITSSAEGANEHFNIMQPTTYMNAQMKL